MRKFLRDHPRCAASGATAKLNVHHAIIPFHYAVLLGRPELELDPRNLLTLCEASGNEKHLLLGHLDNFQSWNKDVLQDVRRYFGWPDAAIKADALWQHKKATRPKLWREMTEKERQDLAEWINAMLPPARPSDLYDPVFASAYAARPRRNG